MKFNTIAEAFNHYMNSTVKEIEQRAAEIGHLIDTDANADVASLNIELDGLKQAKENIEQRSAGAQGGFNPVTGMAFERRASYEATEGDVFASAEYRNAFYKTLLGQKLTGFEKAAFDRAMVEQRADAYSTTSEVAAVIPTQTLNEVVSKARTMGGILSVCRGFNVPAKISIPVGTPSAKASWNTEGTAVDSTEPTVAAVNFGNYEIIKVFSISASVKRMSVSAFENYLSDELAACVMECLADGVVNGTGSAQGTGLLPGIVWATTGTGKNSLTFSKTDGLKYADVVKTVALLKRGYANGARWAMNNATLYSLFYGLCDNNDRPIFIADPKSEEIGKILGFPVVVDDNLADEVILFGNFNYMGYNLPEGIMVEASTQSSFKSGRIDYRAMAIADCKPIVTEAFVKLTRSAT
jgi:HK97 family phage major capsid protein